MLESHMTYYLQIENIEFFRNSWSLLSLFPALMIMKAFLVKHGCYVMCYVIV